MRGTRHQFHLPHTEHVCARLIRGAGPTAGRRARLYSACGRGMGGRGGNRVLAQSGAAGNGISGRARACGVPRSIFRFLRIFDGISPLILSNSFKPTSAISPQGLCSSPIHLPFMLPPEACHSTAGRCRRNVCRPCEWAVPASKPCLVGVGCVVVLPLPCACLPPLRVAPWLSQWLTGTCAPGNEANGFALRQDDALRVTHGDGEASACKAGG